jgi:hypothetical protein
MQFPTFQSAESASPIDDGGKEVQESYEPYLERTNADYQGDDIAVRRRVLRRQRRDRIRLLTEVDVATLGIMEDKPIEGVTPPIAFFDYYQYRRGSRGKMAVKNEDVFIFWGQHMILSLVTLCFWTATYIFGVGYKSEGTVNKLVTKLTRILMSAFMIKFLFISFGELGLRDITRE